MRFERWMLLAATLACVAPASRGLAQTGTAHENAQKSVTVTDPYARYTRPGQCAQAAARLETAYWRDQRPDTMTYTPRTTEIPAPVVQAARACAARFSVATVPSRDLLSLVQLSLWTQQPELTRAALARLREIERTRNASQRGWMQHLVAISFLGVTPTRLDDARQQLAALDSIGTPAATWRMLAHTKFSIYDYSIGDVTGANDEGRAALAANTQMTKSDRVDWATALTKVYGALVDPVSVLHGAPAALALLDTAETVVTPLRGRAAVEDSELAAEPTVGAASPSMVISTGGGNAMVVGGSARSGPSDADQFLMKAIIAGMRSPFSVFGKPAQPVQEFRWFGRTDAAVVPRPGVVTLLVAVNPNCGPRCYGMYASLKRLDRKYAAAGLQIVLTSSTSGYFFNHLETDPSVEADKIHTFLSDVVKLPGPLGVESSNFTHIDDGRRFGQATSTQSAYFPMPVTADVIGKDGVIHFATKLQPTTEKVLDDQIAAALAK